MNEQQPSSTESLSLFSNLPHELFVQILLRLPVRSLLRSKCVCKSWRALISDPQFGKSHYDLAASPTHRCLTKGNDSEIDSIDVDAASLLHNSQSCVVKLKFPIPPPPHMEYSDVELLGSCRGFVLKAYPLGDVFVWNPSTGEQRRIADDLDKRIALDEMIARYPIGFGYHRSTDDYWLVIIDMIPLGFFEVDPDEAANIPTTIRIFSMKTNSWFSQEGTYAQYVDMGCGDLKIAAFLNDALHWLVTSHETGVAHQIALLGAQNRLAWNWCFSPPTQLLRGRCPVDPPRHCMNESFSLSSLLLNCCVCSPCRRRLWDMSACVGSPFWFMSLFVYIVQVFLLPWFEVETAELVERKIGESGSLFVLCEVIQFPSSPWTVLLL